LNKRGFLILSIFFSIALQAQEPLYYQFTRYTTSSGLITHEVNSIIQDKDGFMWIGTPEGLQRFDGIRYKTFLHRDEDPRSIGTNLIWQILSADDNNIWVLGAFGTIGLFDTHKFTYREIAVKHKYEGALNSAVKKIMKDDEGRCFLLLGGVELLMYDKVKNEFVPADHFIKLLPEWRIADFRPQPGTKKYWIAIQGGGFAVYNAATDKLSYKGNNSEKISLIDAVPDDYLPYSLFFDNKNRIWFVDWQGPSGPYVNCFDLKENKMVLNKYSFIPELGTYYEISGFYQQDNGTVWALGLKVFAKFLEKEQKFQLAYNGYLNEKSIVYEHVRSVTQDREHNLWVATNNNGIYRFNPQQEFFTNIMHRNRINGNIGFGDMMSFAYTKWGTLLAGSWGDGLYHYDKNLKPIPTDIKGIDNKLGPTVWSMFPSTDDNTIWMSAQPGIYKINQDKRSAEFFNPPQLENRTIRQIAEDKYGNLWIGMQHIGLFKWNKNKGAKKFEDGISRFGKIPISHINKLRVDSKGLVWVATPVKGLFAIDPSNDEIVFHLNADGKAGIPFPENPISSVLEYNDSIMIVTTSSQIFSFHRYKKTVREIGKKGVVSGFITAIEKDKNGFLWLTTTTGLYRINVLNRVFVRFNRDDGIQNDHFLLAASAALPDGRIIFGSSEQFIVFNPVTMSMNAGKPASTITGFSAMNKPLLVDSLLTIKKPEFRYNNNSFVIQFSPLNYSGAYLLKYKLEGLDKEWKFADKENQAVYSYVPPGNYTFMLAAVDENANITEAVKQFSFRINPPFWKAWWFYSLEVLMFAGLLFWFDRERMKRKEAMQKMRNEIASNLHEEVNNALNNINILSEMARLKAEKDPQKSKEYIEQIHSRSHNMIIAVDDMLWSINPENDNMQHTVERMKEYIDMLKNRFGVEIDLLLDKKVEKLGLNMKLRHESFLLFKEGIKSLVDAGTKYCQIHITQESGLMFFTVQFDNDEVNMQQLHNLLQRHDMEKRLEGINATLGVEIHKSSSLIVLKVPVE